MLGDPVGFGLFVAVSMVIVLHHAAGAAAGAAQHDRAFVLVLVEGMAGHRLKAAQGELRV